MLSVVVTNLLQPLNVVLCPINAREKARFTKHLSVVLCPIVQRRTLSGANVSVRHSLDPAVLMSLPMAGLVCETVLWSMSHPCPEATCQAWASQTSTDRWCLELGVFSRVPCCFSGLTIGKFEPIASCRSQSLVKTIADWKMISKSRFTASAS